MSALKKAAATYQAHVRTARAAPSMSEELQRGLAELDKQIKQALKTAESVKKVAWKAYDMASDLDTERQRAFVEEGNHPDDWNSTPEGEQLEQAVRLSESIFYREFDGSKGSIFTHLTGAEGAVEHYLRWIEKGKY